jgi:hypothetical protein
VSLGGRPMLRGIFAENPPYPWGRREFPWREASDVPVGIASGGSSPSPPTCAVERALASSRLSAREVRRVEVNADRRHLTTGQRAMAVAIGLAENGQRQGGRFKWGSKPDAPAGTRRSTWESAVREAGVVLDHAAELAGLLVQTPHLVCPQARLALHLAWPPRCSPRMEVRSSDKTHRSGGVRTLSR